jgi:hypothetical protein
MCAAAALLALAAPMPASQIFATAGNLGLKSDTQKSSWSVIPPNPAATIQWFVGDPKLTNPSLENWDGNQVPNQAMAPAQPYFPGGAGGALGPVSASFGGPAPDNSYAENSGAGQSQVANGVGTANWSATAEGTLGTKAGASWHSFTTAVDPWAIDSSNFANITGSTYDLFFMAGLTGADFASPDAGMGFDVSYQTAEGTQDLLNVSANSSGVQATEGTLAGLSIYLLTSPTESPSSVTGTPLSAAQIQSLLQGLISSGELTSSVLFGFELNGQAIPTLDLGGGVVAWMNVTGTTSDGAVGGSAVPEPASLSLFAAGGVLIVLGRMGRRKRSASAE